jgi:hypothetical protein
MPFARFEKNTHYDEKSGISSFEVGIAVIFFKVESKNGLTSQAMNTIDRCSLNDQNFCFSLFALS